jgi:serine/threonine protein kinase
MIESKIGKYKIIRLIGEGGMASVYEAEHEMLGIQVAVKVLNPVLSANAQIRERFMNEAKMMASFNHPNITRIIDFDDQPHQLSIVMEFLEGEDLSDKIKRNGPLSQQEVKDIFVQTLSAFQYAHEKGVVHRDIKPSNIYVLPNGHIKILDFGIAKLFGQGNEMTQTGTQMGTPIYMSPEQVKGDKSIDHRSDIYSLGVTMFYALNGKPPYNSETESQFDIFNKIVFDPLPELIGFSPYDVIIKKACQKDREQRFQNCGDWLNEFTSFSSSNERHNDMEKTLVEPSNKTDVYALEEPTNTIIDNFIIDEFFLQNAKSYFINTAQKFKWKSDVYWDIPEGEDINRYYAVECLADDAICLTFEINKTKFSLGTIRHEWLIIFSSVDSVGFNNLNDILNMSHELKINTDDLNSLFTLLVEFKKTLFYTKIHDFFKFNSNNGLSNFMKDGDVQSTLKSPQDYFNFIYSKLGPELIKSMRWGNQITSTRDGEFVYVSFEFKGTECAIVEIEELDGGCIRIEEMNMHYHREALEAIPIPHFKEIFHFIQSLLSEKEYFNYYKTKYKITSFDQSSFNHLLSKHSITKQSYLYLSPNIPEKKQNNLMKYFPFDLIGEVSTLLLYDGTIFGKCDEGLALLLSDSGSIYLYIRDSSAIGLFTINYQGLYIPNFKNITFGRWHNISVNSQNHLGTTSDKFNLGIKDVAPKFNEFLNDLL